MFILDGKSQRQAIEIHMPGIDQALRRPLVARGRAGAGAGASRHSALPGDAVERKSEDAREAWNDDNLMCRAIRAIKRHCRIWA